MQMANLVRQAIRRFTRNEQDKLQISSVPSGGADTLTSRRTLLTGGVALAGVSTLASTDASAAAAYVQLGVINTTTTNTNVTTTGLKGLVGVSRKSAGMGVQGVCIGAGGTGVVGIANSGSGANGVSGESQTGAGVRGTATGNGYGVRGTGGYNGVYGSGGSYGVIGSSSGGYGVYGSGETAVYASGGTYGVQAYGSTYGVYGASSSYGVFGQGGSIGVYGAGATGVYGTSSAGSGVYGVTSHPNQPAVFGSGGMYGVQGAYARTAGVRGDSGYVGVWGEGADWGFFSIATRTTGQNYGIMAESKSPAGYGGYFKGRVHVEGTLTKGGGAFRIDHPLDPERKWLQHSFVESPDMMNVYNGNVTTDGSGLAVVKLPAYFGALNRDFRYQLTVIGKMAQAVVDREISDNQFRIRTSQGNVKVSWQVTGIRQDAYAKEHRIKVEFAKSRSERGTRSFLPKGSFGRLMQLGPAAESVRGR